LLIRSSIILVWVLCAASVLGLAVGLGDPRVGLGPLAIDRLTLVLAAAVTLVSGIVHVFALRYMDGDRRFDAFFGRLTGLTLVVLGLLVADHLALVVVAWLAMGWLLADLIGHVRRWPQARAAASLARRWFLIGGGVLLQPVPHAGPRPQPDRLTDGGMGHAVNFRVTGEHLRRLEGGAGGIPLQQMHLPPDGLRHERRLLNVQALAHARQPGEEDRPRILGHIKQGVIQRRVLRDDESAHGVGPSSFRRK